MVTRKVDVARRFAFINILLFLFEEFLQPLEGSRPGIHSRQQGIQPFEYLVCLVVALFVGIVLYALL